MCVQALRIDGELWIGKGFYWPNTKALTIEEEYAWSGWMKSTILSGQNP